MKVHCVKSGIGVPDRLLGWPICGTNKHKSNFNYSLNLESVTCKKCLKILKKLDDEL